MNQYITGQMIKRLREEKKMTQSQLAEKLNVTDKAISKWETCKGYPDTSLIEPLAGVLGISVAELLAGENVINKNKNFNMQRVKFYVCPVCGNVIMSTGEANISCCGVSLLPADAETPDEDHHFNIEIVEDEYYITTAHPMSKEHYISFIAAVADDGVEIKKLYAEGNAEARFKISRTRYFYAYCNRHGLFKIKR